MEPNISILELVKNNAGKVLKAADMRDEAMLDMYHVALDATVLTALAQGYSQAVVAKVINDGGDEMAFQILLEKGLTSQEAYDIIKKMNEKGSC